MLCRYPPGDRYSRLSRRTNEGSGGGVRSALPARKRIESDGVAGVSDTNSKTLKDGFVVRPRVDAPQTEKPDPSPTEGLAAVGSVLTQTAGVVGATLANTAAATALLLPLHEWSLSRKRVAEAVEASEAAENKRQRTRFEQEQQKEQLQQEGRTRNDPNPWGVLLRDTFPLPRPIENTYRALASVAAVPGKLAKGSKRAAENLLAAGERLTLVGETVATMPDRAQKAIAQARGTARAAQDVAASAPARVEELVAATQELPGQVERALGEGVETITALGEAGRKAAEVAEALPRRLPDLVETAANDAVLLASDVAEGTVTGIDAAGTALWEATREAGGWAAEQVLRQALAPVHEYRASARRVQAALDEERATLLGSRREQQQQQQQSRRSTSVEDDYPTRGTAPSVIVLATGTAAGPEGLSEKERAVSDNDDNSTQASRPVGLRGWVSSWRRKRRSILAVTVADEDDVDGNNEAKGDGRGSRSAVPAGTVPASATPSPTSEIAAGAHQPRGGAPAAAAAAVPAAAAAEAVAAAVEEVFVAEGSQGIAAEREHEEPSAASAAPAYTLAPPRLGGEIGNEDENQVATDHELASRAKPASDRAHERASFSSPSPLAAASSIAYEERAMAQPQEVDGARAAPDPLAVVAREKLDAGLDETVVMGASGSFEVPELDASAGAKAVVDEGVSRPNGAGVVAVSLEPAVPLPSLSSRRVPQAMVEHARSGPEGYCSDVRNDGEEASPAKTSKGGDYFGRTQPPSPAAVVGPSSGAVDATLPLDGIERRDRTSTSDRRSLMGKYTEKTAVAAVATMEMAATVPSEQATVEVPDPVTRSVEVKASKEGPNGAASTLILPDAELDSTGVAGEGGKTSAGMGIDGRDGSSSGKNLEADILEDMIDTAVIEQDAEQEETGGALCWERQWYPVAIVSELQQKRQRWRRGAGTSVRCEILGRTYELRPLPHGPPAAHTAARTEDGSWSCHAVVDAASRDAERSKTSAASAIAVELPVRESSGLLWAWPDTSPEGIIAAALADPLPLPGFSTAMATQPRRWRQPPRRRSTNKSVDGDSVRARQRAIVLERDIGCGYSDALGGLLAASHGKAVEAAATGHGTRAMEGEDFTVAKSLTSDAGSSPGVFRAAFDTGRGQGELLFPSPTVVEWRFSSPTALPTTDATPTYSTTPTAAGAVARTGTPKATNGSPVSTGESLAAPTEEDAGTGISSSPRAWLRRRLPGGWSGVDSDNITGTEDEVAELCSHGEEAGAGGARSRSRRPGKRAREGGAVRYVAVVLPAGPDRTKVFARLEVDESRRPLDGLSYWWYRRVRGRLLVKAIGDAASGGDKSGTETAASGQPGSGASGGSSPSGLESGSHSRRLSSVVGEWVEEVAKNGPV